MVFNEVLEKGRRGAIPHGPEYHVFTNPKQFRELILLLRTPTGDPDAVRPDRDFLFLFAYRNDTHVCVMIGFSFDLSEHNDAAVTGEVQTVTLAS
jgi:hypothetical protein